MTNDKTAPYAALLLRVSLGILFLAHAALKLFIFSGPGFVGYFASPSLPSIAAYLMIALELAGGIALILGVYASWAALPLAAEMLDTILMVHGENGGFSRTRVGGWEYPTFWAIGLFVLLLLGDGAYALRRTARER